MGFAQVSNAAAGLDAATAFYNPGVYSPVRTSETYLEGDLSIPGHAVVADSAGRSICLQSRRRRRRSEQSGPENQERAGDRRAHQHHLLTGEETSFAAIARRQGGILTSDGEDNAGHSKNRAAGALGCAAALLLLGVAPVRAASVLEGLRRHVTMTSTITDNGDHNPYAVVVAPASSGKIQKGDVLIDNFNNSSNLQGTGTNDRRLSTRRPRRLRCSPSCRSNCRNVRAASA